METGDGSGNIDVDLLSVEFNLGISSSSKFENGGWYINVDFSSNFSDVDISVVDEEVDLIGNPDLDENSLSFNFSSTVIVKSIKETLPVNTNIDWFDFEGLFPVEGDFVDSPLDFKSKVYFKFGNNSLSIVSK